LSSLTIVIPTYEEARNVGELLPRLAAMAAENPEFRITAMIVDDSSPDGTADLVRSLAPGVETDGFRVRVETRAEKAGLGAAYIWAFEKLLGEAEPPTHILQMDADLSHDPAYITEMLRRVRAGADLVVASRYIRGGATPDWDLKRRFLSVGGNLYTRLFLGSRITDYTGGFNLYETQLLRRITPSTITTTGYGFQIEMKQRALREARRPTEVAIVFMDRTEGESKIPSDTLVKNLLLVLQLRFGLRRG
jgi:dolichol-phosphate mannosyltransferase